MTLTPALEIAIGGLLLGVATGWVVGRRLLLSSAKADALFALLAGRFGKALLVIDTEKEDIVQAEHLERIFGTQAPIRTWNELQQALDEDSFAALERLLQQPGHKHPATPLILKTSAEGYVACTPERAAGTHVRLLLSDVTEPHRARLAMQTGHAAFQEKTRRFGALLDHSAAPMWMRDRDMRIVYCNLPYMQALGESPGDAEGLGIPELYKNAHALARAAYGKEGGQSERVHIVTHGERRLFQVRETYLSELGVNVGVAQDITALERAEREVASYVSAQEDLLESSSSAIAVFGPDTRLKFFNQAYVRVWGFEEAWLDSSPKFGEVLEHLRDKRRLPEQANFKAYKEQRLRLFTDLIEPKEELHFLPDGRTLRGVVIPHRLGGIVMSFEDVTDRLALERSYNTLIAVQRETLDNLHEGVVVFGEDGRLRLNNPMFLTLWRLGEDDITERMHVTEVLDKIRKFLRYDDWDAYKGEFIGRIQSRALAASRLERADGVVLDWAMVPLPDGGTLLTYTDVTDSTLVERSLREKNEALEAADKLKSEFLANVSYELRSPLTSITGFSEMLRENYFGELNARQREYIENIHASSQHLMQLIGDILDLASIEAGYLQLEIREFDIYKMLNSVLSLLSQRIKEFHLTANLECPKKIGKMQGDETRLRQALFHLLSNAVKYSKESGHITLGAAREGEEIRLWVSDDGVGIDPAEREAIFEKFYRGAAGATKSGTGLGLSMVKNFIELHSGRVTLESIPGQGTTVTCFVPTAASLQETATPAPRAVNAGKKAKAG